MNLWCRVYHWRHRKAILWTKPDGFWIQVRCEKCERKLEQLATKQRQKLKK